MGCFFVRRLNYAEWSLFFLDALYIKRLMTCAVRASSSDLWSTNHIWAITKYKGAYMMFKTADGFVDCLLSWRVLSARCFRRRIGGASRCKFLRRVIVLQISRVRKLRSSGIWRPGRREQLFLNIQRSTNNDTYHVSLIGYMDCAQ